MTTGGATYDPPPVTAAVDRTILRGTPYRHDHEQSQERRLAKGIMPKTLGGLLEWYEAAWRAEIPDALHRPGVWRDFGETAEGGSVLGAPAYSDPFRRYIENAPSETDEDGYYSRPVHAALSRISRRHPLTARTLFAVAQAGFDWRPVAERGHWAEEMFAIFLEEALRKLWREYAERTVRLT